jgi:N-acetylmuramoyl-L-alanine amidase
MSKAQVPVTVYFRIFEIILLVMVIAIIANEVNSAKNGGIYQQKFLSRDLALVLDSLSNARGNVWYAYNPQLSEPDKYAFSFRNQRVDVNGESWPFAVTTNDRLFAPAQLVKPTAAGFLMTRSGNALVVEPLTSTTPAFNGLLLQCSAEGVALKTIMLDPGHGYNTVTQQGDKGFTAGTLKESELMLNLAVGIQSQLGATANKNVLGTRALHAEYLTLPDLGTFFAEEAKTTAERVAVINQHKDAAIISLHVGKQDKAHNIVKAYVNKDAPSGAYTLACVLLNAIATAYPLDVTGTAIIPVDLNQLSTDDPKQVLLAGRVAIQIELGNIDLPNNKVLADIPKLASVLAGGLR